MTVTATYDPADNKIRVSSLHRFDRETYDRLKAAGFSWAPKQELFVAPMWTPEREDLACELADSGELEDEDTSLTERAEGRAERFENYQVKRADEAERTHAAVEVIANGIPLGQPILVGHRSEKRARKDAERIRSGMAKAVKLWETSEYWERRAKGAIQHARYKELPGVRARRIKGLEADERKHVRDRSDAMASLKMWEVLPEGPAEEGQQSPAMKRALFLANHSTGTNRWYELDRGTMSAVEVQSEVQTNLPRVVESHERWLRHIGQRLTYERTLLAADGYVEPVKVRRVRDLGPVCNWPAPNAIHCTKAEMKARYHVMMPMRPKGAPRYRMYGTNAGMNYVPFYLTDQKRKDPPVAEPSEQTEEASQ